MRTGHVKRAARLTMAVLGLALGLAACGDDDDDPTVTGATTTAAPAVTTTAAPAVTTTAAPSTTALLQTAAVGSLGTIVVDGGGYAVYTWDRDTSSTSGCTGGCAATWPPVLVPDGTPTPIPAEGVSGTLATSTSPGGGNQLTLDGKPLYRYSGDAAPGEANGDGVGGVWHVVPAA